MKKILLAALLLSPVLQADQTTYAGASLGGRWLNVMADPRETALAGANDALAENLGGLGLNPASLSLMQAPQINLAHNFWILDLSQEHLAAGLPLGPGAAAISMDYLDLGSVEEVSLGSGGPVSEGYLHPYAMDFGLSWGQEIFGGLALGASGKFLIQNLDQSSATAFAMDLGAQWRMPDSGLSAGLSLQNLGTQLEGASLPLNTNLGLGYAIPFVQNHSLLNLAADLAWSAAASGEAPYLSLGEEFWATRVLALRAGYQFGNALVPSGLCAGLGLRYGSLQLDYAYDSRSSLSPSQQMSLSYYFKNAPSEGARLLEEPVSENQAAYDQLLEALNRKDYAAGQALAQQLSLAQVKKVEKTYANFISPNIFQGNMAEAEVVLKILVDLEPANANYQERLGVIEWHLKKYDEARQCYERALILDPSRDYLKKQIESTK